MKHLNKNWFQLPATELLPFLLSDDFILSEENPPVNVDVCACVCVCVPGVLPGLNGDSSSIPEERGGIVSPKTTPTDTDTDLSIWSPDRYKLWEVNMNSIGDASSWWTDEIFIKPRTSWRIVLLVLFSLKSAEAKHVHFEVIINLSGRLRLFHTGDTERKNLTAETFWGWSIWCFNPDPHS